MESKKTTSPSSTKKSSDINGSEKSNSGTKASMKSSQLLKLSDVAMEAIIVGAAV
ncbi:hypothetical protein [Aquiflexum lacus]|uniref:hypothetical protein n=1 Tax=Aquiflexum lacus TaxID=2483805 RepID=UPI001895DC78|nr:hypothetical protein [Aquiflexum lacus]